MQKKSALTAALTGTPAPAAPAAAPTVAASRALEDTSAFPCLLHAPDDGTSGLATVDEGIEALDLGSVTVVGSAPTNVLLPNGTPLADYALDPYRRRGGKEVLGSTPLSLGERTASGRLGSSLGQNYEAVIGSLPRGLSVDERAKLAASLPLSPAAGALQGLPPSRVGSRSLDGRRLRRGVLKGSIIAFITAGYSGKRFIFEKAHELGVKAVVLDSPDSWAQLLEQEGIIAKFVPIDFSDAEHVFDQCLQGIRKASSALGGLDGVTTFCEMAVPLVSRLAEQLGLPCNGSESVDKARDKAMTRQVMSEARLPTPRNARIQAPEDVLPAAQIVGFPAVIKPVSGAASIGVIRVDDLEQLQAAYTRVVRDLSKAKVVAGALVEGDEDEEASSSGNAASWMKVQLMLEEYLDGPEVDVDLVLSEGVPVYGAITDNWDTIPPYFNETGSNCPSVLPRQQQKELMALAVASVTALGLSTGVFHVELKYTSRGARLIEVNARMGGGPVRDTNLLVWGVDLVEEHLMTAAGLPARPPVSRQPLVHMAEYSINAQKTGILQDTSFLDKWAAHPDVLYARALVKAGQKVVCAQDGLPTWICELMVVKPTVSEAIDFIKSIEASLEIPIDPLPAKKSS